MLIHLPFHSPLIPHSVIMTSTSLPKTQLELEADGDSAYFEGNFVAAVFFFEKCVTPTPTSNNSEPGTDTVSGYNLSILWKLALSLFQLDRYTQALLHCDTIIKKKEYPEPSSVKVKCLWGLGRYENALHFLEGRENSGTDPNLDLMIRQTKTALLHSQGIVDMVELTSLSPSQTHLHIGEFAGSYRVATIPGKGRGLVATADLKGGDLILLKKAFATAFISEVSVTDGEDWKSLCRKLRKLESVSENSRKFCKPGEIL